MKKKYVCENLNSISLQVEKEKLIVIVFTCVSDFKPRSNFQENKSTFNNSNNKFTTNFGSYDSHDFNKQNASRQFPGRSRQGFSQNTFANPHSRNIRPHGDPPRTFRTIESNLPRKNSGHVESYLQEKLTKARQDRGANRESVKQALSPKEKKVNQEPTNKKSPEKIDWSAECENSTELMEREAKANGKTLETCETNEATDSASTNPSEKVDTSEQQTCDKSAESETIKVERESGESKEGASEEDEEWEDLSDEDDKKKTKKKSGAKFYGGYYGRY